MGFGYLPQERTLPDIYRSCYRICLIYIVLVTAFVIPHFIYQKMKFSVRFLLSKSLFFIRMVAIFVKTVACIASKLNSRTLRNIYSHTVIFNESLRNRSDFDKTLPGLDINTYWQYTNLTMKTTLTLLKQRLSNITNTLSLLNDTKPSFKINRKLSVDQKWN